MSRKPGVQVKARDSFHGAGMPIQVIEIQLYECEQLRSRAVENRGLF